MAPIPRHLPSNTASFITLQPEPNYTACDTPMCVCVNNLPRAFSYMKMKQTSALTMTWHHHATHHTINSQWKKFFSPQKTPARMYLHALTMVKPILCLPCCSSWRFIFFNLLISDCTCWFLSVICWMYDVADLSIWDLDT